MAHGTVARVQVLATRLSGFNSFNYPMINYFINCDLLIPAGVRATSEAVRRHTVIMHF